MRYAIVLFLLAFTFTAGCSRNDEKPAVDNRTSSQSVRTGQMVQNPASAGFRSLSPAEAQQLINSRKDLLIVDVRSPEELKEGAIANSVLIPFWQILRGERTLPRDRPLLLVCAIGGRSYAVAQVLQHNGYPELYNLSGGIEAWKKVGLPLNY